MYWDIVKFNFLKFIFYPTEIFAAITYTIIEFGIILVFWNAVNQSSNQSLNITQLTSYFLISRGIAEIAMVNNYNFGRTLQKRIKSGEITNYMIKPVKILPYMCFYTIGQLGLNLIIALTSIVLGIIISPPASPLSLILFPIFFLTALMISLGLNIFMGLISFLTAEASGFKNVFTHITRILSGALVPLTLFPENLRKIVLLTPFPGMIFGPANALKTQEINNEVLLNLTVSFAWGAILLLLMIYFWKKLLAKYEAIGI